jgi:sigma-B regulation protein RsbU (phosphoserine phosphatase)
MSQGRAVEEFVDALLADDPVELYDRAPCGYLSTLPDGVVIKVNGTFLTWTGFTEEALLGTRLTDLLTPGGRIYHETHYAPMLRMQGSVRELALDVVRADGSRLPVLLNATLDRDAAGEPRVVRIAMFDATERRRYERELLRATETAQEAERRSRVLVDTLQATLVPASLPVVDGVRLAGEYRPAGDGSEVGGDFYDAFVVDPGELWLVLGDVSGKGVEAAVVTALVRNAARALATSMPDERREPASVLSQLNELVCQHETSRFCTVAVVRMTRTPEGWSLVYGSGGHVPGILRHGDQIRHVEVPGLVLGAFTEATYEQERMLLGPGDTLMLCTDGVTEARAREALYGEVRLSDAVADAPGRVEDLTASILREVLELQGGRPRDDIACLAVQVTDDLGQSPEQAEG